VQPDTNSTSSNSHGKLIIACVVFSFSVGIILLMTIAQTKSGDPIPPDAAPHHYLHDAG
jgi:uncharacterized membrane protein YdcZ (DUF606 family)